MGQGSLSAWTETVLLTLAFLSVVALIVTNFNFMYDKDYQIGLGTNTTAEDDFINYQQTSAGAIEGGEADFESDAGITLKSSWGITKNAFKILGSFITGGFIEEAFSYTNLGESGQILGRILRIIYFLSLIFAVLYILFKVIA